MSMMIHRAVLRLREAEKKAAEEKPVEENIPVKEEKADKPAAPKRGRKPKR